MNFIGTSYKLLKIIIVFNMNLDLHTSLSIPCYIALFISVGLSILHMNFVKCSFCSFNVCRPMAECSVLPCVMNTKVWTSASCIADTFSGNRPVVEFQDFLESMNLTLYLTGWDHFYGTIVHYH